MSGKVLPRRPSLNGEYEDESDGQSGEDFGNAQNGYDSRPKPGRKTDLQGPNGAAILDGYSEEIINGFEEEKLHNAVSAQVLSWRSQVSRR